MAKVKDMTGQRFGKLKVVEFAGMNHERSAMWKCICDCGKETIVRGYTLRRGDTQSCGCFIGEAASVRNSTHRMTKTRLYECWKGMKSRCYYKRDVAYDRYGGRGIKVCGEWKNDFMIFREWAISHGYTDELTLDRIDPNGDYEPNNCRWLTLSEQQSNRRDTVHLEFDGQVKTEAQWADEMGMSRTALNRRILNGMDVEEALTKPIKKQRHTEPRYYSFNGKTQTISEWAQEMGMNYYTLWSRLEKGWDFEKAILTKTRHKYR